MRQQSLGEIMRPAPARLILIAGIVLMTGLGVVQMWRIAPKNLAMLSAAHTLTEFSQPIPQQALPRLQAQLRSLLESRPQDAVLWRMLGLALEQDGQPDEALKAWERDAAATTGLLLNLGLQAQSLGEQHTALKWYGYAAALSPAAAEPSYRLATVYQAQGDLAAAEMHLRQAVANAPDNRDYWFSLGSLLAEQDRASLALQAFERGASAADGRVGQSVFLYQIGRLYEKGLPEPDINLAEEMYRQAAELDDFALLPNWKAMTYYRWGDALAARSRYTEALEQYDIALSLNPQLYEAGLSRAAALSELGRSTEAEKTLQDLIEADPSRPAAYWALAILYEAQGAAEKAQELRSQARSLRAD